MSELQQKQSSNSEHCSATFIFEIVRFFCPILYEGFSLQLIRWLACEAFFYLWKACVNKLWSQTIVNLVGLGTFWRQISTTLYFLAFVAKKTRQMTTPINHPTRLIMMELLAIVRPTLAFGIVSYPSFSGRHLWPQLSQMNEGTYTLWYDDLT